MLDEIFISALGGLFLHQSRRVTVKIADGWQGLTEHAIGVIGSLPFVLLFWRRLDGVKAERRLASAYLLGFLSVGLGVATGWMMDNLEG